jgi:AcrR family transcriptional regulator
VARPRTIDDEQLLAAAEDILSGAGLAAFTLERVADRAGVSAATLIKRFGSRQGLLLAINERWVASIEPDIRRAVAGERTAVGRLRAAVLSTRVSLDVPERASNHLAAFALDLRDDAMRALLTEGWRRITALLADLADEAIRAGELLGPPAGPAAAALARVLLAVSEGSSLLWLAEPHGSLLTWVGADLDAIIDGWRPAPTGAADQR